MGHTIARKPQLLARVRRLKEQLAELEDSVKKGVDPAESLDLVANSRTLLNGLMADILEDHLRVHLLEGEHPPSAGALAAGENLIQVVHAYMGH